MNTIAQRVVGGVDTHKDIHVAAVLDELGRLLGVESFPTTRHGYRKLLGWLQSHGELEAVGVEGCGSWGAGLARHLAARGVRVLEVNRPNRQERRLVGKDDPLDAEAAARAVLAGKAKVTPKSGDGPIEAVRQLRDVNAEIRRLQNAREDELFVAAKELQAPYELVKDVAEHGKLPVVNFVAGGISTPADAALVMQLGAEGVFVGSGIFKSEDPARMANAIVQSTTFFDDAVKIAEVSKGLGAPMRGIALEEIPEQERLAVRGW